MSKFVFEPHNLHGETIDGEAMPFGYITQIQESGHRLPVFELNTVFGEMPGIDLAGLARIMAAAPAMAALLRGIDRDEDGDAMLDASGMDEIAAILSRIDGAGPPLSAYAETVTDAEYKEIANGRASWPLKGASGDGAGDTLPDAPVPHDLEPAQNGPDGHCLHCGRDNTGHEGEPCADDCPQYWEGKGKPHPEHPTGELVTVCADHLAALAGAAAKYADDLETGLEDGTYDDRADLDAVRAALAVVQGDDTPTGDASTCQHCGEERPLGPESSVWTCGACNGLNCD